MKSIIAYVIQAALLGVWSFVLKIYNDLKRKAYVKRNQKKLDSVKDKPKSRKDKLKNAKAHEDIIGDK